MSNVFIIAEAGVNHNGSFILAKQLVDVAKESGADCVKFQTFKTENLVSIYAKKAQYQIENTGDQNTQYRMLKDLELSYDEFSELKKYCEEKEIIFLSTAFDLDSVKFLDSINMPLWKIPSGEMTNLPYLEKIADTQKPVIISTGMCSLCEVESVIKLFENKGCPQITLLHCTTEYPVPYEEVNLKAMITMNKKFGLPVGYSDHTCGIEVSVAAIALGASVIEKHFTLDKNMYGPDHCASLNPEELKQLIMAVRHVENALGDGIKQVSVSESKNIDIARKSIVAKKIIKKGEIFTEENITTKRPGTGISPMKWYEVIGEIAAYDFDPDDLIKL